MSGIAGIFHFDGAPVEPGLIEKMTSAMSHRGPDGIHHWTKGHIALGQCMLRTTPESLEEHQPLANEDETLVLVMDGRVDNWEELRRELINRGARLRDRSDAELVLRAYETWGEDCLPHIDGDFALVIWDEKRRTAFCARDRTGGKPFYYHWSGTTLAVASELQAVLSMPWVPRVPNDGMLAEYLATEWHSRDETLWKSILRLVPAHCMRVTAGGPRSQSYWRPHLSEGSPRTSEKAWIEQYRALLDESVTRLSRSHRPIGCEVSGGLDSSLLLCAAEQLRRKGVLRAPALTGFTLDFSGEPGADEMAYVRAVAEYLRIDVAAVPPSTMPLSWYAERARRLKDFPGYPNGAMSHGLQREAARNGSRVLLNGLGGDEWLGGSRSYYAEELRQRAWRALGRSAWSDIKAYGPWQAAVWLCRHGVFPLLPPSVQQRARRLLGRGRGEAYREPFWLSETLRRLLHERRVGGMSAPHDPSARDGQRELLGHLSDAFHGMAAEMMESLAAEAGLELRRPLFTAPVIQFALSLPASLRLRGSRNKYVHVRAFEGQAPGTVLDRRTKAEFSAVFRRHLEGTDRPPLARIASERTDWLEPDGVERVCRAYRDNPRTAWPAWVLWSVYGCDTLFCSD